MWILWHYNVAVVCVGTCRKMVFRQYVFLMPSSPRQYELMCSFCMLGVACITQSCGCMQMSVYACVFVRINVGSEAHPWLTSVTGALLFRI